MGVLLLDEQTAPGTPSTGQVVLYPKSDGLLYSKDDAGAETAVTGLAAASQAEQEAGSSTLVATTPGRQQYHPSAVKAWVFYDQVTPAVGGSYNVTSVTDDAAGIFTVNWATDFSDTNYAVGATVNMIDSGTSLIGINLLTGNKAVGSQKFIVQDRAGGNTDSAENYAFAFGDH
jgi:hypothetical protein